MSDFYWSSIEPNLPPVEAVIRCHEWLCRYADAADAMFSVRVVGSQENRRKVLHTNDGTSVRFADNSPAWVLPAYLKQQQLRSYEQFEKRIREIPCHMFDVPRSLTTWNTLGLYVAHIYRAKNRDVNYPEWSRQEVVRRFFLTLHPCNLFPASDRQRGESSELIALVKQRYAERYDTIWDDFLRMIGQPAEGTHRPVIRATRLTFKRDVIEPLGDEDLFEVQVRDDGCYIFRKRDFYSVFANVITSESYCKNGFYNYTRTPAKAKPFLRRNY